MKALKLAALLLEKETHLLIVAKILQQGIRSTDLPLSIYSLSSSLEYMHAMILLSVEVSALAVVLHSRGFADAAV